MATAARTRKGATCLKLIECIAVSLSVNINYKYNLILLY
jgi:hypothetical protein